MLQPFDYLSVLSRFLELQSLDLYAEDDSKTRVQASKYLLQSRPNLVKPKKEPIKLALNLANVKELFSFLRMWKQGKSLTELTVYQGHHLQAISQGAFHAAFRCRKYLHHVEIREKRDQGPDGVIVHRFQDFAQR
jgi:hypothetical protein